MRASDSKHPLRITIVDEGGSRQFTMTKISQKILLYLFFCIVVAVIVGYMAMSLLITKLDSIETKRQEVYAEYQSAYEKNALLQDNIDSKTKELSSIQNKVDDLEKMVNMHKHTQADLINNILRESDIQDLDDMQRNTILQIIPNGNPVKTFSIKQQIKKNAKDSDVYSLVNVSYQTTSVAINAGYEYYTKKQEPVYASADGIVESIRVNNSKYGYGNIVRLSHVFGFSSAYANLSRISVKEGDFVSKGDVIGYTTKSPDNKQRSLYYEIRFLGEELDTLSFINWNILNFKSIFDSSKNQNVDVRNLVWALGDIIKLNDLSSHFSDITKRLDTAHNQILSQVNSSDDNRIAH